MKASDMEDLVSSSFDSLKKAVDKDWLYVDVDYSIMEKYVVKRKWYSRLWRKFKRWFV